MAIDEKKLIDADKLIEDLIPILQCLDNPFIVGRIIGVIDSQPSLTFEIIQATKTSDKWIPCSERLPPKPECGLWQGYIVQQENVFYPYVAYFTDDGWMDDDLDEIRNVLAWMPLPPAYKGDE